MVALELTHELFVAVSVTFGGVVEQCAAQTRNRAVENTASADISGMTSETIKTGTSITPRFGTNGCLDLNSTELHRERTKAVKEQGEKERCQKNCCLPLIYILNGD